MTPRLVSSFVLLQVVNAGDLPMCSAFPRAPLPSDAFPRHHFGPVSCSLANFTVWCFVLNLEMSSTCEYKYQKWLADISPKFVASGSFPEIFFFLMLMISKIILSCFKFVFIVSSKDVSSDSNSGGLFFILLSCFLFERGVWCEEGAPVRALLLPTHTHLCQWPLLKSLPHWIVLNQHLCQTPASWLVWNLRRVSRSC